MMFQRNTERKRRGVLVEETEDHMGQVFSEYGTPLTAVSSFRYLVLTLLSTDND